MSYEDNKDQPNPNGKVTTAELMVELGFSIDEALDIHNEVEKLASDDSTEDDIE